MVRLLVLQLFLSNKFLDACSFLVFLDFYFGTSSQASISPFAVLGFLGGLYTLLSLSFCGCLFRLLSLKFSIGECGLFFLAQILSLFRVCFGSDLLFLLLIIEVTSEFIERIFSIKIFLIFL